MTKAAYIPILMICSALSSPAQRWCPVKQYRFWNNWSITLQGGITSYFGDLSYTDWEPLNKISTESGGAFGGLLTKDIFPWLSFSGQLFGGSIKGGNDQIGTFHTNLVEYNIQGSIDFLRLFVPGSGIGLAGKAGIGQILLKGTTYLKNDGTLNIKEFQSRVPEYTYFVGGQLYYRITRDVGLSLELTLHKLLYDKLDNLKKNDDYDYFTYLNAGIIYRFNKSAYYTHREKTRIYLPASHRR